MNESHWSRVAFCGSLLLAATMAAHADDGRRAAIDTANANFSAALAKGDSRAIAALYTTDGQLLPQGSDPIQGNAAIQKFLQDKIIDAGVAGASLRTVELYGTGSSAAEVGEYEMRSKTGDVIDHGRYLVIWRRVHGVWKLHRDMFASSVAPKS